MVQPISFASNSTVSPTSINSFGRKTRFEHSAPDLTAEQLSNFQSAILKADPAIEKYGIIDLKGGYSRLFYELKSFINNSVAKKEVTPNTILDFTEQKKLGPLEEASDANFEVWELRLLQKGWISEVNATHWAQVLQEHKREDKTFDQFLDSITASFAPKDIKEFQELSGLSEARSTEMMALIAGKFALFKTEQPDYDIAGKTRPLLVAETEELTEHKSALNPERLALLALSHLYTRFEVLPAKAFSKIMSSYVRHDLNLPISTQDMLDFNRLKFMNRQYYSFAWDKNAYSKDKEHYDSAKAYNDRKAAWKSWEKLEEIAFLSKAEQLTHQPSGQRLSLNG